MQVTLYNGEALGTYQSRKRKKPFLVVISVILTILFIGACVVGGIVHWSDISALFIKDTDCKHTWNTAILKSASCTEDGLVLHTCEECGEEGKEILYAYGHRLVSNTCVDCGAKASEGLRFTLKEDEEGDLYAVILGMGDCKDRALMIPSIIGGLPVQEIAENAFKGNLNIYSVSISESVKKIGDSAFADCKNLYTILLPQGIEELGVGAFHNTAYYNDEKNWDEQSGLYRQGYLLEDIQTIA